jgi:hypothetical protein
LAELDSLDYHEERLPLFDDIRHELGRVAAADVPDRVTASAGTSKTSGPKRRLRLTVDVVLQRSP